MSGVFGRENFLVIIKKYPREENPVKKKLVGLNHLEVGSLNSMDIAQAKAS